MSYKFLGDELCSCYLILQRAENYARENYADDPKLIEDIRKVKMHCGDQMRAIGYTTPVDVMA